jgi:hypothetical protein
MGDYHVRFCERPGGRFPRPTRQRAQRQPGLGDLRLMIAIDVRVRRVVNGPKAPYGRFRSMPPRRPLVGGLKLVGF